jgi:hypothetical protein
MPIIYFHNEHTFPADFLVHYWGLCFSQGFVIIVGHKVVIAAVRKGETLFQKCCVYGIILIIKPGPVSLPPPQCCHEGAATFSTQQKHVLIHILFKQRCQHFIPYTLI